jgi:hypothetical protein
MTKPQILSFQKFYSDDSNAVEFEIEYQEKVYLHNKDIIGTVTLKHIDEIDIPVTQLDWLISCLERIRTEIN